MTCVQGCFMRRPLNVRELGSVMADGALAGALIDVPSSSSLETFTATIGTFPPFPRGHGGTPG